MTRIFAVFLLISALGTTSASAQSTLEEGLKALLEAAIEAQSKKKSPAQEETAPERETQLNPAFSETTRDDLNDPFDATRLTKSEARILQAGLAYEGHYNALLDGAWGRGSQRSMNAMVRARHNSSTATWQHAVELQNRIVDLAQDENWRPVGTKDGRVSVLMPMRYMRTARTRNGLAWQSVQRDMQVRILPQSISQAQTLANSVAQRHQGAGKAYLRQNGNRIVASVSLADDGGIYMRTLERSGVINTILIEWNKDAASRAKLVIASIRGGTQAGLALPQNGVLEQIVLASQRPVAAKPERGNTGGFWPLDDDVPAQDDALVLKDFATSRQIIANGFYINNTDVVTNSYALRDCENLILGDGHEASVVIVNNRLGIAVITSAARSSDWMNISQSFPDRQDALIAVGYTSKDENAGLGAERATVGYRLPARRDYGLVTLATPMKIADLGSPLLDENRNLAGLLSKHPKGDRRLEKRHFVSADRIKAFLEEFNVFYAKVRADEASALTETRLKNIMTRVMCAK